MNSAKRMKRKRTAQRSFLLVILYTIAAFQLFPLIWLIDYSLCKSGDLFVSGILHIPDKLQFQNYVSAWIDGKIPQFFLNSLIVTGTTVILTLFLSITLGYAFTRMKWKLKRLFLTVIMTGMMIPIYATLLPNFIIFNKIGGMLDTYQGLIIPYTAFAMPVGIFVMTGFLESIPRSIEEAAAIDGCGIYRIIFQIVLPITKPAIVTISVQTFLSCWNEFIMATIYLNTDKFRTLPFSVMNFAGQYSSDYAKQFAVMALAALPAIVFYIFLNEHITKGATIGALKG
jgi:raffinose/stachyose/melibiose transport system permease protein